MKQTLQPVLLALIILSTAGAHAQTGNIYLPDTTIRMMQGGAQKTLAWSGGLTNAQFAMGDLNNDGLKDMVVYEWRDRYVRTFLNKGTSTAAVWQYAPRYAANFYFNTLDTPTVVDYLKLEDYNRDGIADLIHRGVDGFAIYKGYFNPANELSFRFYKNLRFTPSGSAFDVNAFSQGSDIPSVIDVDGDGDLDFFAFDGNTGGMVDFFKNCQVERGLPKDSIVICNPSHCWGRTLQTFLRSYFLRYNPSGDGSTQCQIAGTFNCERPETGRGGSAKETRHQGNCLLLFDGDGDGDVDMLDGNISFNDVQYLTNGRAQYGGPDSMIRQDTIWSAGGRQIYMPSWPAPFYVDGDGDGKRDLIITPHAYTGSENYKTVQFYKNTGTTASPVFSYQGDTFLVDKMVDAGSNSYPVLYDYNRDGRPDLFVGSSGYYDAITGSLRSRISYYQNGGAGAAATLNYMTGDFGGISAEAFSGAAPAFGDLTGDGKDDMVIGHNDGTISLYKNTAATNSVQPQWVLDQRVLKGTANDVINPGDFAAPYIYDINRDGKPDLLIGTQNGSIAYYRSAATGAGSALTFQTDTLGGFLADTIDNFRTVGYSSLWIGKMDNTGAEYLLSGNYSGRIVRYTGFGGGNVTTPYRLVDAKYSDIKVGYRSTVAVGDIDGDGSYEMIVGNYHGGLQLYRQSIKTGVGGEALPRAGFSISPNPAAGVATVSWKPEAAAGNGTIRLSLYNALGQQVMTVRAEAKSGTLLLPLGGLPSGIYICRIVSGGGAAASLKLSVMQ